MLNGELELRYAMDGGGRGWLGGPACGLELDREATRHPPPDVVAGGVLDGERQRAAADLEVEVDGPVGGKPHEDVEVLRQHQLEPLELHSGQAGRVEPLVAIRVHHRRCHGLDALGQVVEGEEDARRAALEARVERGHQVADAVLVGLVVDGVDDAAAALGIARLEPRQYPWRHLALDDHLHLGQLVALDQVEALEVVEEVVVEVEVERLGELTVHGTDGEGGGPLILALPRQEHAIAVLLEVLAGAAGGVLAGAGEAHRREGVERPRLPLLDALAGGGACLPVIAELHDDAALRGEGHGAVAQLRVHAVLDEHAGLEAPDAAAEALESALLLEETVDRAEAAVAHAVAQAGLERAAVGDVDAVGAFDVEGARVAAVEGVDAGGAQEVALAGVLGGEARAAALAHRLRPADAVALEVSAVVAL